jgi:hypothetical protein
VKCYFRVQTIAIRPLSAEICPPSLMLPRGTLCRIECNLRGTIVVLVRNEMKKETSKRTILLETSHEMRKEIVETNKKIRNVTGGNPQEKK